MLLLKLFFLSALATMTLSTETSSRVLQGYPAGYLSDCPGSNMEARISRNSLKRLEFVVVSGPNILISFSNKTFYNYYQMKALAQTLDFNKKTVLFVNGYVDSNYYDPLGFIMGSAYKRLGYNVISLEYNAFSAMIYPKAVRFLRPVGKHTAEMLAELTKYGLDPKKLELVGVSHGGQAISFIAKNYRYITGTNVSRVTSLDPSGPCFRNNGPAERIDASDADFVEIIHTNIDGYGMAAPVGHIDFYVNGGEYQPGDFVSLPCTSICSHSRSFTIWLAALFNPRSFIAMKCDSVQDARDRNCFDRKPLVTNILGLDVDKSKQGIFYLMSNNVFPYAMGARGLKRKYDLYKRMLWEYTGPGVLEI